MKFSDWLLMTIREDEALGNWLEEIRFDITQVTKEALKKIETGVSVIVVTDDGRDWFSEYITQTINKKIDRPLLPFIKFESMIRNPLLLNSNEGMELIKDMLSIAFPNGFIFWYIGISNTRKATLAKNTPGSYNWIMDEEFAGSIYFSSKDHLLDLKLIQFFKLFDQSISATIYGELTFT